MQSVQDARVRERAEPVSDDDRRRGIGNMRRHTARGMLVNGSFDIGLVGLSVVRGLIVAVFLTRSDYGVWGLLGLTLWTALGLKWVFGADEKYVQQDEADQELAFQKAFTVEVTFAVATAPIAAGIVFAFAALTGHPVLLAPGLILLLLLPATALEFSIAPYYRRMQYRRERRLQAVDPVTAAVVTIALAVLGAGYWSFVVGLLAGGWAGALVAVRACPYRLALRFDAGTLRRYVGFSAPLMISGMATLAMFQVLVLVGSSALGLAGLGTFTLVGNVVQFTDQADAIITGTLYPAICAIKDRMSLLAEVFVKSNRMSLMWAVPFGVGVALFASDLVRFGVGSRWSPAVPLLEIMGIVTAVHHVGYNWVAFFKAHARNWPIAILAALNAVVVIGLAIPLMYRFHLLGIGYAFAAAEAVGLVARGILLMRFFQGFQIMRQLARGFAPSALAAGFVLALRALAGSERTTLEALGVFACYVAVTAVATAALERSLLAEALSYLRGRHPQLA